MGACLWGPALDPPSPCLPLPQVCAPVTLACPPCCPSFAVSAQGIVGAGNLEGDPGAAPYPPLTCTSRHPTSTPMAPCGTPQHPTIPPALSWSTTTPHSTPTTPQYLHGTPSTSQHPHGTPSTRRFPQHPQNPTPPWLVLPYLSEQALGAGLSILSTLSSRCSPFLSKGGHIASHPLGAVALLSSQFSATGGPGYLRSHMVASVQGCEPQPGCVAPAGVGVHGRVLDAGPADV